MASESATPRRLSSSPRAETSRPPCGEWKRRYAIRAGVEGIRRAVAVAHIRRSRYLSLAGADKSSGLITTLIIVSGRTRRSSRCLHADTVRAAS
jgi:hypothetical protein